MCGIFGGGNQTREDLDKLAAFNVKRGNRGFGGLSLADNQEIIFRYSCPYNQDLFVPQGDFILCHLLASTGDARRVHPFETDRFILAHNGILLDYNKFIYWRIGPVDSQYLLGGIQYEVDDGKSTPEAIKSVNEKLKGQCACWMWDKFDKIAYFWRVMSPLYYSLRPFVFSSSEFDNSVMMEEGWIYSFDYKTNSLSKKHNFKFYSPYQV